jgi:hypothetical protein
MEKITQEVNGHSWPQFMHPEVLITHSDECAVGAYTDKNAVHTFQLYFFKKHFNIVFRYKLKVNRSYSEENIASILRVEE